MAQQSYARTVLNKALELAKANKGEVQCGAVADALEVNTPVERKRCLNILSDLAIDGKLIRLRQGVYGPVPGIKPQDKRVRMWNILRMRKRITVDDLAEMAEVSVRYAREWLLMLVKREIVRKIQTPGQPGVWILRRDSREMPEDEVKAEKLRNIRRRQKTELTRQLGVIDTALSDMRKIIDTMEDQ